MKRTLASIVLLVLVSMASLAQTSSATPNPAPAVNPNGVKVGVIDMQGAIAGSNEGQRDFETLAKKFEPRSNALVSTSPCYVEGFGYGQGIDSARPWV